MSESRLKSLAKDLLPPTLERKLRLLKNRRNLFGTFAHSSVFQQIIPQGSVAVDAGANSGTYSWFIAERASTVHAFEPNPLVFPELALLAPRNVTPYNVGLSDVNGQAQLGIPSAGSGEATLRPDVDAEITVDVELRRLDDYAFDSVGYIKIDVEGHEEALLAGAKATIREWKPTVFIELEDRHNEGVFDRVPQLLAELGLSHSYVLADAQFKPFSEFDVRRDQHDRSVGQPNYLNNFAFSASPI